jgi:hypothetical protein
MPITTKQKQLIIEIDRHAEEILFNGGNDKDLLEYLTGIFNDKKFKKILESSKDGELDTLCEQYTGFRVMLELLEQLALFSSQGRTPKNSDELLAHWRKNGLEKAEPQGDAITDELNQTMRSALFQLQKIIDEDLTQKHDFLSVAKIFLNGIVTSTADLVNNALPGSAQLIYADVEAAAKIGGIRAIRAQELEKGSRNYSVSNIGSNDFETGMNYLGQELTTALFKGLHELPLSLRTPEMLLRGVETLLANLLDQKFKQHNAHAVLDNFCEHVHLCLTDLEHKAQNVVPFKRK